MSLSVPSSRCVPLARSFPIAVLMCPSLCALELVGVPYSHSISVVIYRSHCAFQDVSLARRLSFSVLTCPCLCALQDVSVSCTSAFFCCIDLPFSLHFQYVSASCLPYRFPFRS